MAERRQVGSHYDDEQEERIREGVLSAEELQTKSVWDVMNAYEDCYGPATQNIDSFNHFMKHSLPEIVTTCGWVEFEERPGPYSLKTKLHRVKVLKVQIEENITNREKDGILRKLYPHEARMRNLHYCKPLSAQVQHRIYEVDSIGSKSLMKEDTQDMFLGNIPIMIKSEQCSLHGLNDQELIDVAEDPADPGGYFIINGKEKMLMSQERAAINQLFLFKPMCDADYQLEAEIRSTANYNTEEISALWIRIPGKPKRTVGQTDDGEARATELDPKVTSTGAASISHHITPNPTPGWIAEHKLLLDRKYNAIFPGLIVWHMALMEPIPLLVVYKALGITDDKSMWETLGVGETDSEIRAFFVNLRRSLENEVAVSIKTQKEALIYIGRLRKQASSEKYENKETGTRRVYTDEDYYCRGLNFVNNEILPHVGNGEDPGDMKLKSYHIGYMVNRLINAHMGWIPCDDRDHLQNKRFDLPGPLLAVLLKRLVNTMFDEMRMQIKRKVENKRPYDFFRQIGGSSSLTRGFLYAFMSGNWGDKRRCPTSRVGVVQPLTRLTGVGTLSFLRRINCPVNRLVRMTAPRNVHNTGFGYICPSDTPEGEPVGLLKNLAIMAHISVEADQDPVLKCLEELEYCSVDEDIESITKGNTTKIFLNANLIGSYPMEMTKNPAKMVAKLKQRRSEWDAEKRRESLIKKWKEVAELSKEEQRKGLPAGSLLRQRQSMNPVDPEEYKGISNQVSIMYDRSRKEIKIRTDGGRATRPLFVVENNEIKLRKHHIERLRDPNDSYSWPDLIKEGIIEFLDAAEEETAMIAMFPRKLLESTVVVTSGRGDMGYRVTSYTHCEINPSAILGVCASLIPYADHDQSPRVTYQANMAKQSIGIYMLNYKYRYDSEMHVLNYPQKPLVTTKAARFSNYDQYPAGINAIVSIQTYLGYNQEDSVIMNSSAIQRGLFRSLHFKTKTDEARVQKGMGDANEMFECPKRNEVTRTKLRNYQDKLDEDGLPSIGALIQDQDPIIGKTQKIPRMTQYQQQMLGRICPQKEDITELYKISSASRPGHIDSVAVTENNDGYRMVKVRVRTERVPQIGDKFASRHGQKGVMGMTFHEVDLPFTKDGTVPDIIMNPHAIPSRMTIGHLKEMCTAKIAAGTGQIQDGTCFTERMSYEDLIKMLEAVGCHKLGMETMYLGDTGRKINSLIFIAPCFYQRLKHMTEDKLHFRARGPLTALCKQPNSGLQREGGLRFGEMERDSALAHGGFQFLRERLLLVSDLYYLPICKKCGQTLIRKLDPRPNQDKQKVYYKCSFCNTSRVGGFTAEIPYACKLLFQELACMNIKVVISAEETGNKPAPATEVVDNNYDIVGEEMKTMQSIHYWKKEAQ